MNGAALAELSDADLVTALGRGHRLALGELYDRHSPQMTALATRVLGDRRDAEDLLHDVFLEVWRKAASYDPKRGTVRSWLLLRLRSRAIDRGRALGVAQRYAMAQACRDPEPAPSSSADPCLHLERARARRALDGLSNEQRAVVELSYFQGLACREIAERCQIPVGTVKSRLSAALEKLRAELCPAGRDG